LEQKKLSGVSIIVLTSLIGDKLERILETFIKINSYHPFELLIVDPELTKQNSIVVKKYQSKLPIHYLKFGKKFTDIEYKKVAAEKAIYPNLLFYNTTNEYNTDSLPVAMEKLSDRELRTILIEIEGSANGLVLTRRDDYLELVTHLEKSGLSSDHGSLEKEMQSHLSKKSVYLSESEIQEIELEVVSEKEIEWLQKIEDVKNNKPDLAEELSSSNVKENVNKKKKKLASSKALSQKVSTTKRGKIVFLGYYLSKHPQLKGTKFRFWLGKYHNIEAMFNKCIVLENTKKSKTTYDSDKWTTYKTPKFLYDSKWSLINLIFGMFAWFFFRSNHREAFEMSMSWEKSIIKSFGLNPIKKLFSFVKVFNGLGRVYRTSKKVEFGKDDVLVIHAISPVADMLTSVAKKGGAKVIYTELGELPLTCFVSEEQSIHHTWPLIESKRFNNLPVNEAEVNEAANVLYNIAASRQSTRPSADESNIIHNMDLKNKTVIYINGIYPYASGLEPRDSERSRALSPNYDSNQDLLNHVAEMAERNNWIVLYKDHPLTTKLHPNSIVKSSHKNVYILEKEDIHEILDVADVTVSLASKSILLSLARGVPVSLAGPYTIPKGAITPGVIEMDDLEASIKANLANTGEQRVNQDQFNKYFARLRKYYLYPYYGHQEVGMKKPVDVWRDLNEFREGKRRRISVSDAELESCLDEATAGESKVEKQSFQPV
jgi:hypothetical protein